MYSSSSILTHSVHVEHYQGQEHLDPTEVFCSRVEDIAVNILQEYEDKAKGQSYSVLEDNSHYEGKKEERYVKVPEGGSGRNRPHFRMANCFQRHEESKE